MFKYLLSVLLLLSLSFPFASFAKAIDLYEEPKDKAKVLGTLDSEAGIIPIFTPEKGDWIKVADPRNGNVGWVKTSDLGKAGATEYSFTQRFINTGTTPQSYQVIQFGSPKKMSPQEMQTILKQNQLQQEQLQKNINKMVEDMNKLYQNNANWFSNNLPMMMPIIVMPTPVLPAATKTNTKTKDTNKD